MGIRADPRRRGRRERGDIIATNGFTKDIAAFHTPSTFAPATIVFLPLSVYRSSLLSVGRTRTITRVLGRYSFFGKSDYLVLDDKRLNLDFRPPAL